MAQLLRNRRSIYLRSLYRALVKRLFSKCEQQVSSTEYGDDLVSHDYHRRQQWKYARYFVSRFFVSFVFSCFVCFKVFLAPKSFQI